MRIAITGLSGFLGRHLATALARQGMDVVGFGRQPESKIKALGLPCRYAQGDLLDAAFVKRAVADADCVVHLASTTTHAELTHDRIGSYETIVNGTRNVVEALRQKQGPKKIIYTSTGKVYGQIRTLPLTEDHIADPLNVLGKAKFLAERVIDYYAPELDRATILRVFNVYGPGQISQFLVPTIINQLHLPEITLGDIKARRDYVYVADVVQAILAALNLPQAKSCSVYNVCSGVASSAEEIVQTIGQIQKRPIRIHSRSDLARRDELPEEFGSFAKLQEATGWTPKYSLLEGLQETLAAPLKT